MFSDWTATKRFHIDDVRGEDLPEGHGLTPPPWSRVHVSRVVDWRGMDVLGAAVT